MSGNSIGKNFVVTTFGESHGVALGAIIDGCPPNMKLDLEQIQAEMERRRGGRSRHTTQRKEADKVEILSGVFDGKTTGTPIGLIIYNEDQRSKDYSNIEDKFRPGHADFTYWHKYKIRDHRGGGRSSARETAMRVAAGAIAKQFLSQYNIKIRAGVSQIGAIKAESINWKNVENDFFFLDSTKTEELENYMDNLRKEGNSIGAEVLVEALNVPIGLGEPIFDRLDAEIAKALMSVNAVKGVEIGAGFASVVQKGTEHRDKITKSGFETNNSGGILGGISTGQTISARVAFKPTSSLRLPIDSLNTKGEVVEVVTKGRHDPCVGIRGVPVVEAMLALTLADHILRDRAQNFQFRNCE